MRTSSLLAVGGAALAMTLSAEAKADTTRGTIDWGKVLVEADHFARHGTEQMIQSPHITANGEHLAQIYEHNAGNAWFGVAPSVTLVARDWGEAYRLAGDRLSLTDALRLSSSTRMVLTRVRLS